jgi:outer membrane protein assembly factor BamB
MLLFATVIAVAGTTNNSTGPAKPSAAMDTDPWSMFGHDAGHSGFSVTSTVPLANSTIFAPHLQGTYIGGIVAVNGKIYTVTYQSSPATTYVYGLDAYNGSILLNRSVTGGQSSTPQVPTVINGNLYYITLIDKKVHCLNLTTLTEWTYTGSGLLTGASSIVANGLLYIGSTAPNEMTAVNITTHLKAWSYATSSAVRTPAAVSGDRIYFIVDGGKLYCLNALNGQYYWSRSAGAGATFGNAPTIVDGNVYVGANNGNEYRFNAINNATEPFVFSAGGSPGATAVANGKVYFGDKNGAKFYCVWTSNMTQKWNFTTEGSNPKVACVPAVGAGKVFFGNDQGYTYCLDADVGGVPIWSKTGTGGGAVAYSIYDGHLYKPGYQSIVCFYANQAPLTPTLNGSTSGGVGVLLNFTAVSMDPDNDMIRYGFDFHGQQYPESWTSYVPSGTPITVQHAFPSPGMYQVLVVAEDAAMNSNWSIPLNVTIINHPPQTPPAPTGPSEGFIGTTLTFSSVTTDPDGNKITYGWNWTGGTVVDEWSGAMDSGVPVNTSHMFLTTGTFGIKVMATDGYNETAWSAPHTVVIKLPPTPANLSIGTITGGGGILSGRWIKVEIINTGETAAANVVWNITLSGGGLLWKGRNASGMFTHVNGTSTVIAQNIPIRGFGLVNITVKVSGKNIPEMMKWQSGFVYFFRGLKTPYP